MISLLSRQLFVVCFFLCLSFSTHAQKLKIAQEHTDLSPFNLLIQVLEKALAQHTENAHLYWVDSSDLVQARALTRLESCDAPFDIYFSGYDANREERLLQVEVPLTLGLLGARGFVTTKTQQQTLQATHPQEWIIGSGLGWPDTAIMLSEGYQVSQAPYENLWKMLETERIQVFQRGLQEAQLEIAQLGDQFVLIERTVMLYPLASFLYVSPCRPDLHRLLEETLIKSHQSGQTQATIRSDPQAAYALSLLSDPNVEHLILSNPLVSDPFIALAQNYFLKEIRALLWPEKDFNN
ncbi:hypothetical protein SAMN05660443_0850 [Marinospirillum celere]|uniref:ABC-type amino acid transport substrate-binding protein n=1 Tax=Marinospirillum celere TaxID=1122252 RepID=A0A1I1F074_9GAMM|nr:hypothetical protein [Marinospirillum celere]SFB90570.1 hypothetical protein SAMN05660443_0850 [Marinospirillum celere]